MFARGPDGRLTQQACVTVSTLASSCAHGRALETPAGLALSPDGRNLYVAARNSGAIAVFARNRAGGGLTQLAGRDACVSSLDTGGRCATAPALGHPEALAVSADGKNVYAAGDGVVVFARNESTGALSVVESLPGSSGQGVAVTPDGTSVYLVAGGGAHGSVTAFARDLVTGVLTELGCIAQNGEGGCLQGVALRQPGSVAVSSDGKSVYVASSVSSGVAVFLRTPAGTLAQLPGRGGCVTANGSGGVCTKGKALVEAISVAVSPDGKNVYVAAFHTKRGGLAVFARDPLTGRLDQNGCVSGARLAGCAPGRNLVSPAGVAVSPDGLNLYTASVGVRPPGQLPHGGGVAVFRRG